MAGSNLYRVRYQVRATTRETLVVAETLNKAVETISVLADISEEQVSEATTVGRINYIEENL